MKYFYFFVEGNRDEDFISSIICPYMQSRNPNIIFKPWQYQQKIPKKVNKFLSALNLSPDYGYIFLRDFDANLCIKETKVKLKKKYQKIKDDRNIIFVIKAIESWLVAGIMKKENRDLYDRRIKTSEKIEKMRFERLANDKGFGNGTQYCQMILSKYDIDLAMEKNNSFKYFIERINQIN